MPWKESRIVNERVKFIADVLKGEQTLTELGRLYGIARKTGYQSFDTQHQLILQTTQVVDLLLVSNECSRNLTDLQEPAPNPCPCETIGKLHG
jgi:hypothetical protein